MKERYVTVSRTIWNEEKLRSLLMRTLASMLVQFGSNTLEEREETVSNFSKACDFSKIRNEVAVTFSGYQFFFSDLVEDELHFDDFNRVVGPSGQRAQLENAPIVGLEIHRQGHTEIAQDIKLFFADNAHRGFKGVCLENHETHSVVWAIVDQKRFRDRTRKLSVPVLSTREWVANRMAEFGEVLGGNQ